MHHEHALSARTTGTPTQVVGNSAGLLAEMLGTIPPEQPAAVTETFVQELAETCIVMRGCAPGWRG
jgi:hypothetical protein